CDSSAARVSSSVPASITPMPASASTAAPRRAARNSGWSSAISRVAMERSVRRLLRGPAAVDRERGTGDVVRLAAAQPGGQRADLRGQGHAQARLLLGHQRAHAVLAVAAVAAGL